MKKLICLIPLIPKVRTLHSSAASGGNDLFSFIPALHEEHDVLCFAG